MPTDRKHSISEPRGAVKSTARALELLSCFSTELPEWGVSEIAEYLGIYKSAAHRFLTTFEQAGFIERTADRRYRLGIRTLELGAVFSSSNLLIRAAERPLQTLAEETGSIGHLMQLDGRETIEQLRKSGMRAMTLASHPVIRRQAHATSSGKLLLAFGSAEKFQRFVGSRKVLKRYTPHTVTNPDDLRINLQRILDDQYAIDDQESCMGVRCLAIPVRDGCGKVVAAVSISNTLEKFNDKALPSFLPSLFSMSKDISCALK